jgi:squalene cyclase
VAYKLNADDGLSAEVAEDFPAGELPVLPPHVVEASLRRLAPEEINLVLKHKLVPTAWLPHRTYFAAAAGSAAEDARAMLLTVVGVVRMGDYRRAVRR